MDKNTITKKAGRGKGGEKNISSFHYLNLYLPFLRQLSGSTRKPFAVLPLHLQ